METIVKAIKIGEEVNTFIGNIVDQIIKRVEIVEEFMTFVDEYFHEHPDEIDIYGIQVIQSFIVYNNKCRKDIFNNKSKRKVF